MSGDPFTILDNESSPDDLGQILKDFSAQFNCELKGWFSYWFDKGDLIINQSTYNFHAPSFEMKELKPYGNEDNKPDWWD